MQKLAGIASELMGNAGSPANQTLEAPEQHSGSDTSDELMGRLLPVFSNIAQSGQKLSNPAKRELLHALRPFLSSDTCAKIDHAEHILQMAQMAKAAAEQFLPQYSGTREV